MMKVNGFVLAIIQRALALGRRRANCMEKHGANVVKRAHITMR